LIAAESAFDSVGAAITVFSGAMRQKAVQLKVSASRIAPAA